MLMTREMDYALRILRALHQGGQLSAASIAQKEQIPKATTLKVLKELLAAGLVSGLRGVNGGYVLNCPCETLYLRDLFRALGEPVFVNRCQMPGYRCENNPGGHCGVCRELSRIQEALDKELCKTPLSAMFQEL